MIYIENLLESEKCLPKNSKTFKNVLGDTFLFSANETYRIRRLMALRLKIKFKKGSVSYGMAPLLCLPKILKNKTVPYIENKKFLLDLDLANKKISIENLIFLGTKKNNVLHETSHVIMWLAAHKNLNFLIKQDLMLGYLLSESFANYSETIANMHVKSDLHKKYLMLNSFWSHSDDEDTIINRLRKKHGSLIINTTLFLCFLYTNFLYKKLSSYECENIRLFIGLDDSKLKTAEIKELFAIASQLNIYFLMKTGEIFWKTLGINENLYHSLDFDPVVLLLEKSKLQKIILNIIAQD